MEGGSCGREEGVQEKERFENVLSLLFFCNLQSQGIPSQKIEAMCITASVIGNSGTPRQCDAFFVSGLYLCNCRTEHDVDVHLFYIRLCNQAISTTVSHSLSKEPSLGWEGER
ncbi:hypothetical protein CEXT_543751 [Caerostris extrusa]|uniref:Uncharacterized protein n=1 Tax=Caerostris extrusa TaxID=172846 RepID=A0AAV4WJA1_CAEEX|nr:hypothetical protein CEXT_543751 [Caerostris extrusa]